MISLEDALAAYARELAPLAAVRVPLEDALGQVLAQPAASLVDLPMFTQSAVDGYALRSADVASATAEHPVSLKLVGEIAAGSAQDVAIPPGCAARIFTGGALPATADASARQEIVERAGETIVLRQAVKPGADTRFLGEEIKRGEAIGAAGLRVHSGLLSALAMAGIAEVSVRPRPRIAVIVSGDEVADPGRALRAGEIYDANGPLIRAWLRERGFPLLWLRRVRDDRASLADAMREAFEQADVVLSSGGVSVGDRDYIPGIATELGVRKVFWNVAQKPGKPLWFGVHGSGKPLLAFPGNPAAVLVGLHVHAARMLAALEGAAPTLLPWHTGVLAGGLRADARDRLLRVSLSSTADGRVLLQPLKRQDSHMMSNLAAAQALAWVPCSDAAVPEGAVLRWQPI